MKNLSLLILVIMLVSFNYSDSQLSEHESDNVLSVIINVNSPTRIQVITAENHVETYKVNVENNLLITKEIMDSWLNKGFEIKSISKGGVNHFSLIIVLIKDPKL